MNPNLEAGYYHAEGDDVVCDLCPHRCRIRPGYFGKCNSRKNNQGKLVAYNYGRVSSLAVDPVEKKPLYHYRPGTSIFSVGGIGCNMHCEYCQNYPISQSPAGKKRTTYKSPAELAALCRQQNCGQIAFTYNEPVIWTEYIKDVHSYDPDLDLVIVSNGMIEETPMKDLCRITKAMNIDVKSFSQDFYDRLCGGKLDAVKDACETAYGSKVHLELTYLVIPGFNDDLGDIKKFVHWVIEFLSPDTPVHFTRFHPDYNMMDVRFTSVDLLMKIRDLAESEGLKYAYIGNVMAEEGANTYCPECGKMVIRRTGYKVDITGLDGDRCAYCRHRINIIR